MRHRCIYTEKPFKHSLYYTACTKHFPVLLCTLYFPVLLCTTKLAESTSLYYFVLRSLHKACPSTTVYYKACTNHFPVFSLCYKACAKYIPVLLCTTKLAQSTSQYFFVLPSLRKVHPLYYFVLQSLHKAHPTNTLYYKAYTKHVPVLLCTTPSKNQSHTKTNGPHPPRTRGIPCIAGRSHFTRKKQGFVRRLPPQHKPHATFTQPLQFVLQQLVYTIHHAAITMRFATADSKTPYSYAHTTKQALQNTIKEPITNQNERTAPAAHTRYLSSPAEATLYKKTQGFVFRLPPQTKANATRIQPLNYVLQQQVCIWLCDVTHTTLHECIVMLCKVSRRPS